MQFLELKVKIRNRSLKTTIANSARFEEVLVYGELFNNFVKYLIIKISRNQSIKISLIKFFKLTKFNFKPCFGEVEYVPVRLAQNVRNCSGKISLTGLFSYLSGDLSL